MKPPALFSRRAHIALLCLVLVSLCIPTAAAAPYPAAERLFRQDTRWLGTDGVQSTRLAEDRLLWTFDDSFVAAHPPRDRRNATLVRNSIAIQRGTDPSRAKLRFYWGSSEDGQPGDFFPSGDGCWFWTGAALRLTEGPLVVFLTRTCAAAAEALGFRNAGFAVAVVDRPDHSPQHWNVRIVPGPTAPFDAVPATTLVRQGEHVVALAVRQEGTHAGALVRYRGAALAAGDLGAPEWWAGEARGWLPEAEVGTAGPAWVLDDAGSENTIHLDARTGVYVHVASYGFGAAEIGLRRAPRLTGPWTEPRRLYRPPENALARPFVYAAMAHPELEPAGDGELVVSYATNSFRFEDLLSSPGTETLYWPRFISVRVPDPQASDSASASTSASASMSRFRR